jgi:hypothetical protein
LAAIGDYAFYEATALTQFTVPTTVTYIGPHAFRGTSGMATMAFPPNSELIEIGDYAFFEATALRQISIPSSVTRIGQHAFRGTSSMATVAFTPNSELIEIGDYAFYEATALRQISIPSSVTRIGNYAFSRTSRMATMAFTPTSGLVEIGEFAFYQATALTQLTVPTTVTFIGSHAFREASRLASISLPPRLTRINDYLFSDATALTSIVIPEGVVIIGHYSFRRATALTTATLPASLTRIGTSAFSDAPALASLRFAGNAPALTEATSFGGTTPTIFRVSTAKGFDVIPWSGFAQAYWMPAPAAPTATAGTRSATVSAVAPNAVTVPTSLTISAVEDPSRTCVITGTGGSCTMTGLTPGASYTFTATAADGFATSEPSAASAPIFPSETPAVTPAAQATIVRTRVTGPTVISTTVRVTGSGVLRQVGTRGTRRVIACTTQRSIAAPRQVTLTCNLNAAARAVLRTTPIRVRLITTFTPPTGAPTRQVRTVRIPRFAPAAPPVTG